MRSRKNVASGGGKHENFLFHCRWFRCTGRALSHRRWLGSPRARQEPLPVGLRRGLVYMTWLCIFVYLVVGFVFAVAAREDNENLQTTAHFVLLITVWPAWLVLRLLFMLFRKVLA